MLAYVDPSNLYYRVAFANKIPGHRIAGDKNEFSVLFAA